MMIETVCGHKIETKLEHGHVDISKPITPALPFNGLVEVVHMCSVVVNDQHIWCFDNLQDAESAVANLKHALRSRKTSPSV
jgi:hypothetical protein